MVKKKKKFKSIVTAMNWKAGSTMGLMKISTNKTMERMRVKKKKSKKR